MSSRAGAALAAALAAALGGGCECGSERHVAPIPVAASAPPAPTQGAPPRLGPLEPDRDAAPPAAAPPAPAAARAARVVSSSVGGRDATAPGGGIVGRFIVDALVDIAGAGPATATERGVAMVNRENELLLAPLATPSSAPRPRPTPLRALPEGAGPFPLAKGPAVREGYAYWVSRGRLLRRALLGAGPGAVPEVLREDARVGTRVALPQGGAQELAGWPQLAAYVSRAATADAPLTAKLWVEGIPEPLLLTDESSSASSVALLGTREGLAAVSLDARTGMSSLHLRRITRSATHELLLGEDRIVWVGGPSRSSTEFLLHWAPGGPALGMMALERDITHFGLLTLSLPLAEAPEPLEPDWLLYENGIEPAPFAGVELCGRRVVALARPSSAAPDAPQELVLLELERLDAPAVVLARSRAFFDVSLCALGPGALLTYVADQRTWGRSLRCAG